MLLLSWLPLLPWLGLPQLRRISIPLNSDTDTEVMEVEVTEAMVVTDTITTEDMEDMVAMEDPATEDMVDTDMADQEDTEVMAIMVKNP